MTQERPTRTVLATVQSKAETADGYRIELIVPEFQSAHPTIVTRVPAALAATLQVGLAYPLVLEQQNIVKRKDGTVYDGSKPWMYYWGLVGVATGTPATVPQGQPRQLPTPPAGAAGAWPVVRDDTRISIERQKALDIAERFYARFAADDATTINEHSKRLLALAQRLALWLESGQVPREASRPAPATQGASQWPAGAVPTGQGGDPMPEDDDPPF